MEQVELRKFSDNRKLDFQIRLHKDMIHKERLSSFYLDNLARKAALQWAPAHASTVS